MNPKEKKSWDMLGYDELANSSLKTKNQTLEERNKTAIEERMKAMEGLQWKGRI